MTTIGTPDASWSGLARAAESGELLLDGDVGLRCARRCEELVRELKSVQARAKRLDKVDGLGTLPSGVALAAKFGRKASGGDYSLDRALADHIAQVEQMRDLFAKIGAQYQATEDANQHAMTTAGGGF